MQSSKRFWRGLFFILLITALCGGLTLPIVTAPARAAPNLQASMQVIINEIAWAGTAASSSDEWIELYNPGATDINLTGWILRSTDNSPNITLSGIIPAGGYYLLERSDNNTIIDVSMDLSYSGGLNNTAETLELRDNTNILVDTANQGGTSWFAGNAAGFYSMERISVQSDSPTAWATNNGIMRNGLDQNSNPINGTPKQINSATLVLTATVTFTATNTPTDTGTPTVTGTATSTGTPTATGTVTNTPTATTTAATGSATSVVISEFRTRGPSGAEDEFVEIYNPTSNPVDISGWIISGSNSSGTVQNRATIPAATLLRSGQYYLIAHNSYTGTVSPNLRYGTSISNDGGIALLNSTGDIVDEVGMDQNSFYQEGTPLSPLSGTSNGSYERRNGGTSDSCVDTDDNASDFIGSNSGTLHNYSSPLSLCGTARPAPGASTTLITGDTPDPSTINGNVSVSVRVSGGATTPTGKVSISGANTNCTITLNASGTGSCSVKFTSNGIKTLTAIYLGDNTHSSSSDTEPHQVGTTTARTPTRTPPPPPPPALIAINEFVPRPGHDWNSDGVINVGDEFIELINHGVIDVNLSGYTLDDEVNIGSRPFPLPSVTLRPGERRVFYGSETNLLLSDGGDGVRLIKPNGQLGDAYNYRVVRFPDQSYCRLPDNGGLDDWNQNCFPTPGLQNSLGSSVNPPTSGDVDNLCPIADTLPADFVLAECPPFGINIWNAAYWDRNGWYNERFLPKSPGKWNVFVD